MLSTFFTVHITQSTIKLFILSKVSGSVRTNISLIILRGRMIISSFNVLVEAIFSILGIVLKKYKALT
jgi:hypothetical protein